MISDKIKNSFVLVVSYLYVLLFVYAAVSKLLDYENFQVQLGQSPLLSAFAGYVAFLVPIMEILCSILLLNVVSRRVGFYLSFALMVMFTLYIYIILNHTSFTPCSCGGILEELSWNEHIVFNLFFVLLALICIFLLHPNMFKKAFVFLGITTFLSVGLVIVLFQMSEKIIHHHNNFTRRFPHFPAVSNGEVTLSRDTYYFAGSSANSIYLGNYTYPLQVLEIDSSLRIIGTHKIKLDRMNLPFTAIQVKVQPPYFYVVDGNVPCVFRGAITDWNASYLLQGGLHFSHFQPIDSSTVAFRTILKKTKTNTLGLFNLKDTIATTFNSKLIEKQIDGVFDTDGHTLYDNEFKRLIYVYTYRNQFIVTNEKLNLLYRGNTIDTTSRAQLKVATISSTGDSKLAAPPLIVNKTAAVHKNLLFVKSNLPGKYESLVMWEKASIVDIYNLDDRSYWFSFYIYDVGNKQMRSLFVSNDKLYALIGKQLVCYDLRESITSNYRIK